MAKRGMMLKSSVFLIIAVLPGMGTLV